jgi:hypothetical protein
LHDVLKFDLAARFRIQFDGGVPDGYPHYGNTVIGSPEE